MSDDIETLRGFIGFWPASEKQNEAVAALERMEKERNGFRLSLKEIVAERDSLRKALDDRFAADQRAAKAIFASTGRKSGFPSVKDVVSFYVSEVDRLEADLSAPHDLTWFWEIVDRDGLNNVCSDERGALGELVSYAAERDSLRAKLEKAKEALDNATSRARMNDSDGVQVPVDNYHLKNGQRLIAALESVVGKGEGKSNGE